MDKKWPVRFINPDMFNKLIQWLESWQHYLLDLGWFGILAFAAMFVAVQLFLIPVAPMGLAAGLFFGFGKGWVALMLGCAIGASVNFLISRHVARAAITKRFGSNERFRLIDDAIGREGWKIVALLRFAPIPFGFANYCYGLTPIPYLPYLAASCLAIIPANSLFVWIGSTFQGSLQALVGKGRAHHPLEYVLLGVGLIAGILALRYLAKVAQNAVNRGKTEPAA